MKIIITSTGNNIDAEFDSRFGRANWFCCLDDTTNDLNFIENPYKNENGGAGTKAAELMAEYNAETIIAGDFGPKAKSLIMRLNIKMETLNGKGKTIGEIIKLYNYKI
ncbi:MAG TPA: NifB/NifX family molybdenum-iron cluster-binding protein [Mariniphaga sp.]|nr:NifB/NifX family molybdenum-iron cluster-binding protein [Mariniphaga sp.]